MRNAEKRIKNYSKLCFAHLYDGQIKNYRPVLSVMFYYFSFEGRICILILDSKYKI